MSSGDSESPALVMDNTPPNCTTGGDLTFSANLTDNVSVVAACVNYTYGGIFFNNLSMDNVGGEMWNKTITVDVTAIRINYTFFFKDAANNTNITEMKTVGIIDTIPPVADAGKDIDVGIFETYELDATESTDNIYIVNYTWSWEKTHDHREVHYSYSPIYTMLADDDMNITLNVSDAAGNWDIDLINVTVLDTEAPMAFAGDDVVIDQFDTVYFNGNQSWDAFDIIGNYSWTFFYNASWVFLYGVQTNFTFEIPGNYSVSLRVIDLAGHEDSESLSVTVRDITPPVARSGGNMVVDQYARVTFDSNGSYDNIGIVNYTWSFMYDGEMRHLHGPLVQFTFVLVGEYNITLDISDEAGNRVFCSFLVVVRDVTKPAANVGPDYRTVGVAAPVIFDAGGSSDNMGIVNYTWTFDYNGTRHRLYGMVVTFTFHVLKEYIITLTVTDEEGNEGIDQLLLTVVDWAPPRANAGPDVVIDQGASVTLNAAGTRDHSSIGSYNWSFTYDGTVRHLSGIFADFRFDIIGTYSILLEVTDSEHNTGIDELVVRVRDSISPVALAGNDRTGFVGDAILFNGSGQDNVGVVDYSWKFLYNNSEQVQAGSSASFLFELSGAYPVTLTVTDEEGNTGTDIMWINVSPPPVEDDDTDDDNGIGDDDEPDNGGADENEAGFSFSSPAALAIMAIVFLAVVIILIAMLKKRSSKKELSGENEGKREEVRDMEVKAVLTPVTREEMIDGEADHKDGKTDPGIEIESETKGKTEIPGVKVKKTDGADELSELGEMDGTDVLDELKELDETDELGELEGTDGTDELGELKGTDGTDELGELKGTDGTDELGELEGTDGMDELGELKGRGELDELGELKELDELDVDGGEDGGDKEEMA